MGNYLDKTQLALEQAFCYKRRLEGTSFRDIVPLFYQEFGRKVTYQTVANRVSGHIAETIHPLASEYRQMELDRLDSWQEKLKSKVEAGEESAINISIKINESRRKLLGLDAPQQVQAAIAVSPENSSLGELIAARLVTQRSLAAAITTDELEEDLADDIEE